MKPSEPEVMLLSAEFREGLKDLDREELLFVCNSLLDKFFAQSEQLHELVDLVMQLQ